VDEVYALVPRQTTCRYGSESERARFAREPEFISNTGAAPLHWGDEQGSRWFLDETAWWRSVKELKTGLHGDGYEKPHRARPTSDGLSR